MRIKKKKTLHRLFKNAVVNVCGTMLLGVVAATAFSWHGVKDASAPIAPSWQQNFAMTMPETPKEELAQPAPPVEPPQAVEKLSENDIALRALKAALHQESPEREAEDEKKTPRLIAGKQFVHASHIEKQVTNRVGAKTEGLGDVMAIADKKGLLEDIAFVETKTGIASGVLHALAHIESTMGQDDKNIMQFMGQTFPFVLHLHGVQAAEKLDRIKDKGLAQELVRVSRLVKKNKNDQMVVPKNVMKDIGALKERPAAALMLTALYLQGAEKRFDKEYKHDAKMMERKERLGDVGFYRLVFFLGEAGATQAIMRWDEPAHKAISSAAVKSNSSVLKPLIGPPGGHTTSGEVCLGLADIAESVRGAMVGNLLDVVREDVRGDGLSPQEPVRLASVGGKQKGAAAQASL